VYSVELTKATFKTLLDHSIADTLRRQPTVGYREIAAQHGCSLWYVVKIAKAFGIQRPKGRKPGIPNKRGA
jgi:hypothetical protein